ncbi:MAG: flagellar biosynthesis protein FlhF [Armatimonadota bacterium]|nr:flagellar biosynthesis protein FlhF [bacterium]
MRIKTFEAPTMQEALMLAKVELGEDAVVLNTKHVKSGGLLGLGGHDRVELMAAVESGEQRVESGEWRAETTLPQAQPVGSFSFQSEPLTMPSVPQSVPSAAPLAARLYGGATAVAHDSSSEVSQLRSELRELSSVVERLLSGQGIQSSHERPAGNLSKPLLMRVGVDENIARNLLSDLLHIEDPTQLASMLAAKIQGFAMPTVLDSRQVIAVVGPTGVGKTTTLAKLAAKYSLEQGKKVALVTADTYRIGAVEQLRTYARIMGVPIEIALSPEEVTAGVARHQDKDVVLIDTVGRSQRSDEHLQELKAFVDAASPTQTHLVIAASLSPEIQREAVEKFKVLSPTRLIITKLDESPNRGCVINLPLSTGLGISCMTAGQNVPQDIDFAEAGKMARVVVEVA